MVIQRIIQIVGGAFIIFMVVGGGFAHREQLADGAVRTTIMTMYPRLPPAPEGPSYCSILDMGERGLYCRAISSRPLSVGCRAENTS